MANSMYEKMLHLSPGRCESNHSQGLTHACRDGPQRDSKQVRIWREGKLQTLLVGMQTGAIIMGNRKLKQNYHVIQQSHFRVFI